MNKTRVRTNTARGYNVIYNKTEILHAREVIEEGGVLQSGAILNTVPSECTAVALEDTSLLVISKEIIDVGCDDR